jgi:hypothetical protein
MYPVFSISHFEPAVTFANLNKMSHGCISQALRDTLADEVETNRTINIEPSAESVSELFEVVWTLTRVWRQMM